VADVTSEGKELIDRWRSADKRVASLRVELLKAQRELQTAEERLAIWLLPSDAMENEKYCVWYGDSLIGARELESGYEVFIRKRGKSLLT